VTAIVPVGPAFVGSASVDFFASHPEPATMQNLVERAWLPGSESVY
jgi:hypothetical protein